MEGRPGLVGKGCWGAEDDLAGGKEGVVVEWRCYVWVGFGMWG